MSSVKLLDLHQDVLYEIFDKLKRQHLYFHVRHVCKIMKQHVDSYMSLTGKFMLCDQSTYHDQIFTRIAYIFKTNSSPFLVDLRETSSITQQKSSYHPRESFYGLDFIGSFGGVINGKIIVGYYCKESIVRIKSPSIIERLLDRRPRHPRVSRRFCRLVPYLNEYQESTGTWISIPLFQKKKIDPLEYDDTLICDLSFNIVGDTIVVGLCNRWVEGFIHERSEFEIVKFQFQSFKRAPNVLVENKYESRSEYSFHSFKAPYAIKGEKSYETINLTALDYPLTDYKKKNICIHGFTLIKEMPHFFFCQLEPKHCTFDVMNTRVRYPSLKKIGQARKCVSFKLKDNIYVIGLFGIPQVDHIIHPFWSCDRFDTEKEKYHEHCHLIPSYIKEVFSAATDSSESYALILTDVGLLTFTEDNGFKYEGCFKTSSTDFRDSESVLSDPVSWDSYLNRRPCFAMFKSSLFRIS